MEDTNPTGSTAPDTSAVDTSTTDQSSDSTESQEEALQSLPPEVKKRIKQLQLKVDGEEYTEELPFEVDEEHAEYMKKHMQMSKVSQKRMQESKQLQSEVEKFFKTLKGDTRQALQMAGIDAKAFAAQILEEEMKLQALSPAEREKQELQAKLKALEEERKKEKDDFNQAELARLQQQEYEKIDTQITTTIEKSGLPKSPQVVKRIAEYMLAGAQKGVSVSPDDVIDIVKEEIYGDLQHILSSLGEDKVENFIGKDVLTKIRKKNLAKAKTTPATAKAGIKDTATAKAESKAKGEPMDFKKFFKV